MRARYALLIVAEGAFFSHKEGVPTPMHDFSEVTNLSVPDPSRSSQICGAATECPESAECGVPKRKLLLECPPNQRVSSIDFASYGNPSNPFLADFNVDGLDDLGSAPLLPVN